MIADKFDQDCLKAVYGNDFRSDWIAVLKRHGYDYHNGQLGHLYFVKEGLNGLKHSAVIYKFTDRPESILLFAHYWGVSDYPEYQTPKMADVTVEELDFLINFFHKNSHYGI